MSDEVYTNLTLPVARFSNQRLLTNGTLRVVRDPDQMMQGEILRMEAEMVADGLHTLTASVGVEVPKPGVWNAICVYWIGPLLAVLHRMYADLTGGRWLRAAMVWAFDKHKHTVSNTEIHEVPYRVCPHLHIPEGRRHVDFLIKGGVADS